MAELGREERPADGEMIPKLTERVRASSASVLHEPSSRIRCLPVMTSHTLPTDHADRIARAHLSLDGLSVGDAYGDRFFSPATHSHWDDPEPFLPPPPWLYSDDTEMALGILEVLERHGTINQDDLARTFGRRWKLEPRRGYGPGAYRQLMSLAEGGDWRRGGEDAVRRERVVRQRLGHAVGPRSVRTSPTTTPPWCGKRVYRRKSHTATRRGSPAGSLSP